MQIRGGCVTDADTGTTNPPAPRQMTVLVFTQVPFRQRPVQQFLIRPIAAVQVFHRLETKAAVAIIASWFFYGRKSPRHISFEKNPRLPD
jgi:hypothetical protein